ncbi:type II toxin-antitoxin system HicB family antitoxin [Stanieria cyanosphaera]|nr:type II toxin-antitoxin system HicB family antitoxin [Stanieria cyanosphaera]
MKNLMEYKGYLGSVDYNDEDKIFYGRVEYIRSLISYEGHDVESLRNSFQEAVDDYLELVRNQNIEPEQSFKGSFKIRTGSNLHRRAVIVAKQKGINLNKLVNEALEEYLKNYV